MRNEALSLYRCKHSSIIKCIEFVETDKSMLLVLEYYKGSDIQRSMERRNIRRIDEVRLRKIARQVAEGLVYLH